MYAEAGAIKMADPQTPKTTILNRLSIFMIFWANVSFWSGSFGDLMGSLLDFMFNQRVFWFRSKSEWVWVEYYHFIIRARQSESKNRLPCNVSPNEDLAPSQFDLDSWYFGEQCNYWRVRHAFFLRCWALQQPTAMVAFWYCDSTLDKLQTHF